MQFIIYFSKFIRGCCPLLISCFLLVSVKSAGQSSIIGERFSQIRMDKVSSPQDLHPLTIGDKVPDIVFDSVINYSSTKAKLSDFKSNLTILDFWSSGCSACIEYFPRLQSFKDKFKNDLQIILVNSKSVLWHDNEAKIIGVLQRMQAESGVAIHLPVVFNCSELDHYFPYQTLPHEIWLNEEGVVIAITGAEEVTAANIGAILDGKKIAMHMKNDISFDLQNHPLSELIYGTELSSATALSSSVLVKGIIDGLGSGMGVRHADGPFNKLYTGWYVFNLPLLAIYRLAYGDKMNIPANQVFVETHNSGRFRQMRAGDTSRYSGDISMDASIYSCDITVPPVRLDQLMEYVQDDLERTFHATVINEKRKIKCFVMKATPQSVKSFTKGGSSAYNIGGIGAKYYVRNYPASDLVRELDWNYFKIPLINETGLTRNVDIEMPHDLSQHNIILALEKAGFKVKEEEKDMDVAIIIDK